MKLRKRFGGYIMLIGVAMQFINIITYGLWEIDIDILGVLIFFIGSIFYMIAVIRDWRNKK